MGLTGGSPIFLVHVGLFAIAALACFGSLRAAGTIEHEATRSGLVWLLILSGLWAAAQVAFLLAPNESLAVGAHLIGLIVGLAAIGPWLILCSAYTGRRVHRAPWIQRIAVFVFLVLIGIKLTNPLHGLYFSTAVTTEPFEHLAVEHGALHWIVMGFAYALAAVGYAALLETAWQRGRDMRPFVGLVALTALPVSATIAGTFLPGLLALSYEPLGVAAFAVGVLFGYREEFESARLVGRRDEPIIVLTGRDQVRDYNDGAAKLFQNLQVGRSISDIAPGIEEALEDGSGTLSHGEGDDTRYYQISVNALGGDGRVLTIADVTNRERYRADLERQNERLEEFASIVSHDLRNPLAVAQGHIDLVRSEYNSEKLDTARTALDRMETLIDNMLTLARQGLGIDATEAVSLRSMATQSWTVADTKSASLSIESDERFKADPDRLSQLFENLFRNAVEHGGSDVSVTVGRLPKRNGFYISDNGPGIPKARQDRIFDSGYSTTAEGTGFGLAIVREIVTAHGWSIEVMDSEAGGVRFEISGVDTVE